MKSKALTGLMLRVIVAAYIIYLAWKILSGMWTSSPIPVWGILLICLAFAGVAAVFCVYAWKFYKNGLKAAEISADPAPVSGESELTDSSLDKGASDAEDK